MIKLVVRTRQIFRSSAQLDFSYTSKTAFLSLALKKSKQQKNNEELLSRLSTSLVPETVGALAFPLMAALERAIPKGLFKRTKPDGEEPQIKEKGWSKLKSLDGKSRVYTISVLTTLALMVMLSVANSSELMFIDCDGLF